MILYTMIRNNLKHSFDLPLSVFLGDKLATSNSESAKLFASFFESFYTSQDFSPVTPIESPILTPSLPITITGVFKALYKTNTTSSSNQDGIPALFLKKLLQYSHSSTASHIQLLYGARPFFQLLEK